MERIPKIIHYCWFGKGLMPASQQACIDSWKKYMPDWQIKRWDESNFDVNKYRFSREAYGKKKWAFVTDILRLVILNEEGGIYLDTDIELFKPLDEFCEYDFFSSVEYFPSFENTGRHKVDKDGKLLDSKSYPESCGVLAAVMGAKPGNALIKKTLATYLEQPFVLGEGKLNTDVIIDGRLANDASEFGFRYKDVDQILVTPDGKKIAFLSSDKFLSYERPITGEPYLMHHAAQSWKPKTAKQKRDLLLDKLHLFNTYKKIRSAVKLRMLLNRLNKEDAKRKKETYQKILSLPDNTLTHEGKAEEIIVSLTSYGKRIKDTLPYALFSLLTQTRKPDRVCVYLNREEISQKKLPAILKTLAAKGVEFYFVEDLRSYKKLIPALGMFPDNPIITVDDDFYFNPRLIESLLDKYSLSDHKTVIGSWACVPERVNGTFVPYNRWKDCEKYFPGMEVSLFAGNGTLYPPHIFDSEICNKEAFMSLAPTADDIWFWAMEKRQNISITLIEGSGLDYNTPVNRSDTYNINDKSPLYYQNEILGHNEPQFTALIQKYGIK